MSRAIVIAQFGAEDKPETLPNRDKGDCHFCEDAACGDIKHGQIIGCENRLKICRMSETLISDAIPNVIIGVLAFDIQLFGDRQDDIPTVEVEHGSVKGGFVVNSETAPTGTTLPRERRSASFDFVETEFCH